MKIALLALLGLVLGMLGGAALGVGAGLAWVEIFETTCLEGYSGTLVFLTFMPLGAASRGSDRDPGFDGCGGLRWDVAGRRANGGVAMEYPRHSPVAGSRSRCRR